RYGSFTERDLRIDDPDGDALTFTCTDGAHGTVTRLPFWWQYTADPKYTHGWDQFTCSVSDGIESRTAAGTAYVDQTTHGNYLPVFFGAEYFVRANETDQDNNTVMRRLKNDSFPVGASTTRIILDSGPSNGRLISFNEVTGQFVYKPNTGFAGTDVVVVH